MEEISAISSVQIENDIVGVWLAIVLVSIFLFVLDFARSAKLARGTYLYDFNISTSVLQTYCTTERNILFIFISCDVITQMISQSVDAVKDFRKPWSCLF